MNIEIVNNKKFQLLAEIVKVTNKSISVPNIFKVIWAVEALRNSMPPYWEMHMMCYRGRQLVELQQRLSDGAPPEEASKIEKESEKYWEETKDLLDKMKQKDTWGEGVFPG